jgi:hypothetical protein
MAKRHTAEEIINKLRQVGVVLSCTKRMAHATMPGHKNDSLRGDPDPAYGCGIRGRSR